MIGRKHFAVLNLYFLLLCFKIVGCNRCSKTEGKVDIYSPDGENQRFNIFGHPRRTLDFAPSVRPSVRLSGPAEEKEGAQKDFTPRHQRHTRPELLTHRHNNTASLSLPAHIQIATLPSAARTGQCWACWVRPPDLETLVRRPGERMRVSDAD